jgi:hypothetical protein
MTIHAHAERLIGSGLRTITLDLERGRSGQLRRFLRLAADLQTDDAQDALLAFAQRPNATALVNMEKSPSTRATLRPGERPLLWRCTSGQSCQAKQLVNRYDISQFIGRRPTRIPARRVRHDDVTAFANIAALFEALDRLDNPCPPRCPYCLISRSPVATTTRRYRLFAVELARATHLQLSYQLHDIRVHKAAVDATMEVVAWRLGLTPALPAGLYSTAKHLAGPHLLQHLTNCVFAGSKMMSHLDTPWMVR